MHRFVTALGLLAGVAAAQVITIPSGTATTEGLSSNAMPWGLGGTGLLVQSIYDSSNFTAQGVVAPITITRLRWRPDSASAHSWAACGYTPVTIKMSTCPLDQLVASPTFANNVGADLTTVFAGTVSHPAGATAAPGPAPFLVDVPLTTPFLYDPNAGDLNIEVDLPTGSFTGTAGLQFDMQQSASCCRVFASTQYGPPPYGAPAGTRNNSLGMVVEVTFAPAPGSALVSSYGTGCNLPTAPGDFASFYQGFAVNFYFDLDQTALTMIPTSDGYDVVPGLSPFLVPSASATPLLLTNDSVTTVPLVGPFPFPGGSTLALTVCANGYVAVASGNAILPPLWIGALLNAPATSWWVAHDYDPSIAGGGRVKFEDVGNLSVVTWDGVWDVGGLTAASASTFQFQFDRSSGAVHVVFRTMARSGTQFNSNAYLVGYSPGGPSHDPGNRDISATLPGTFSIRAADVAPLVLSTNGRPRLGTSINLLTTAVPAASLIGANILSFSRWVPGIDLGSVGMPGCTRYVGLDVTRVFVPVAGTGSNPFAVPANPAFAGLEVYSQGFAFAPGANPLGMVSSNGVRLHIDVN